MLADCGARGDKSAMARDEGAPREAGVVGRIVDDGGCKEEESPEDLVLPDFIAERRTRLW